MNVPVDSLPVEQREVDGQGATRDFVAPTSTGGESALDVRSIVLLVFGAGCAASPLALGFYDMSVWGPIGLGVLALVLAVVLVRPGFPRGAARIVLLGLGGMALWALISRGWAESGGNALIEADRWMLYAAAFALLVLLIRSRRNVTVLLAAATVGIVAIGAYVTLRMASGHGSALFFEGRLNDPLGYVNGQAGFFLLGVWPLVAVAERRHVLWSPLAAAAATMLCSLIVLSQSRGAALAAAASLVVVVAVVPGRRVRAWALIAIFAGVAMAIGPLLRVYSRGNAGDSITAATHRAGVWILAAAIVVGLAWALVDSLRRSSPELVRGASLVLATVLVIAAAGAAIAKGPGVARDLNQQVHSFVHLGRGAPGSRFLSGAGNRYDYWRIAVHEFQHRPLAGVGAGNYPAGYFLRRSTTEDVRQPHSVELQALSELGIVGMGLLCLAIGGVFWALAVRSRAARLDTGERAIAVAGGGAFCAWLAYTSVDWLHLLPGITGVALAGAAALCALWPGPARPAPAGRGRVVVGVLVAAVLVAVAAVEIGRPVFALHERTVARGLLVRDPRGALSRANDSLQLDRDALQTYYVKAAAYARLDDYIHARGTLAQAEALEPHNFVTWALLGDIETRHGDGQLARSYYHEASRLNPRDPSLAALARGARPPAQ